MNVSPVPNNRKTRARKIRQDAAQFAFSQPHPEHQNNGEENDHPFIANYSKGLRHDDSGEVRQADYQKLLTAVTSGKPADFDAIPLGGTRKLTSPQAGMAYDLEGPDAQAVVTRQSAGKHISIRPAPRIDSPENSAEMAELYWMALLRDVNFTAFATDTGVAKAANSLTLEFTDFKGPKDPTSGAVTHATLFRGIYPGELDGPYISQFLLKDIPYGSLTISQRQTTVVAGIDYMTDYNSWLAVQRGDDRRGRDRFDVDITGQINPRYIRNMRDLAHYVHVDQLYEAYLNACLILLAMNAEADPGNPYVGSSNQEGFAVFGGPHILSLLTEVATRALKAVWFQKWFVHRRLRPEAFGGRIHNHKTEVKKYPIDAEILDSSVLDDVFDKHGTYLLPQAFPEGSPTHPAYGAGHATVAGACVTILKAWFKEDQPFPEPVVPDVHGTSLEPYVVPGASPLTVGGELNKVAGNIAIGRNMAGVHWRTDYTESLKLGEAVAIGILEEQAETYNEKMSFSLTKFDGTSITISNS
jgi:hypothetical protein